MLKLLKNFFGANNKNSTPSEWTDESWNTDSYEKMLTAAASTGISCMFGGDDGGGSFEGMFSGATNNVLGADDAMSSTSMFDDMSRPMVNIDGTPMVGDVDIHGNIYGVTSSMFDTHSSFDMHSSFDSGSSWSSSSDSFGSSWSSDSNF